MCCEVWLKLKKNSLLICHNNPIFIKDLTRKRWEDLLSQTRLKMRVKVIGRIFTSLRYCFLYIYIYTDWCMAKRDEAAGFKLLQSVTVQELLSHVESSLAVEFALVVLKSIPHGHWAMTAEEPGIHAANGVPLVTPCAQLQYWLFYKEENHFVVIPLLFKANSYRKEPLLHTKSLMEMYQEIVLGPKRWSCGFFPDSWAWFILCILLMAVLQNYFLTKIHCFWQLSGNSLLPQKNLWLCAYG